MDNVLFGITDRKKVEGALQESEMTVRALLNASTETAFLIEDDGTYVDERSGSFQVNINSGCTWPVGLFFKFRLKKRPLPAQRPKA